MSDWRWMFCWNYGGLWSMKCFFIFMCHVHCNSENPLPFSEGVWSMCNTMQTGRYGGIAFSSGRTVVDRYWPGHQACPLQTMRGVQTISAAEVARELDICWVVHRIVWDQLDYREVCAHWVPKNPTDDDRGHCMGLYGPFLYPFDMLHWSEMAVMELKHG